MRSKYALAVSGEKIASLIKINRVLSHMRHAEHGFEAMSTMFRLRDQTEKTMPKGEIALAYSILKHIR